MVDRVPWLAGENPQLIGNVVAPPLPADVGGAT
jgi:hypothetical protein